MNDTEIKLDKGHEHILDVTASGASSCCGAKCYNPSGDPDDAICAECKEHCSVIKDNE